MNKPESKLQGRIIVYFVLLLAVSGLILLALGLADVLLPLLGLRQTVVAVSGTELQEALKELEARFEQQHPRIELELKFQGSQDMVNNYIDGKNDFTPTVLIPANGALLAELDRRWRSQNASDPFYEAPRPIAKTMLVGLAWVERGNVLFPNGRFEWQRLEQAMKTGVWQNIGGQSQWGSFDLVMTDPTRSNSGQLTLGLWAQAKLAGNPLNSNTLNRAEIQSLFGLVKRSVYQPPRSTDILLQEFIVRGANDADVVTVYESIALHRWKEAGISQGAAYQIYYLNPTVETVSTAAIVRRDVGDSTAEAARTLLNFLTAPEQQEVFVRYGFRPAIADLDLQAIPNSPWNQQIPGAKTNPNIKTVPPPTPETLEEIQRLWTRSN